MVDPVPDCGLIPDNEASSKTFIHAPLKLIRKKVKQLKQKGYKEQASFIYL